MSAATSVRRFPGGGLKQLEDGLKSLKSSKMTVFPEFKTLVNTVSRHHSDMKLAHLTGKPKDLLNQAKKDTQFYSILMNMLLEIKESTTSEDDLRRVYDWYLANKQVLQTESYFGKVAQKEEANQILKQSVKKQRYPSRIQSAHSRPSTASSRIGSGKRADLMPRRKDGGSMSSESIYIEQVGGYNKDTVSDVMKSPVEQSQTIYIPVDQVNKPVTVPMSALVNPHRDLANREAEKAETEYLSNLRNTQNSRLNSRSAGKVRTPNRSNTLESWTTFNENLSYGQDVLGQFAFLGRSGTPLDVRYAAHDGGEMPEYFTGNILTQYNKNNQSLDKSKQGDILQQTLEEFYQSTDDYYVDKQRVYSSKPKSAPARSRRQRPAVRNLGKTSRAQSGRKNADQVKKEMSTDVNLDTVVNIIDSVTEDMSAYKEKLLPEPLYGFRQPVTTNVPTVSSSRAVSAAARPTSPGARTNTPVPSPHTSRPETPHSVQIPSNDQSESFPQKPKREKSSKNPVIESIDWRGKVTPETRRYKWSETKFGGKTYLKRLPKSSLRSAGKGPSGSRPKTAPVTTQEKWKTEKETQQNRRVAQAASHVATNVDKEAVEKMMKVQYLGGHTTSDSSRYNSARNMFNFNEELLQFLRRKETKKPSMEFLSFLVPKSALFGSGRNSRATRESGLLDYSSPPEPNIYDEQNTEKYTADNDSMTVEQADQLDSDDALSQNLDDDLIDGPVKHDVDVRVTKTSFAPDVDDVQEVNTYVDPPVLEEINIDVTSVPSHGISPLPLDQRGTPPRLSASEHFKFSTDELQDDSEKISNLKRITSADVFSRGDYSASALLRGGNHSFESIHSQIDNRVERSAGRVPGRPQTASEQVLRMAKRQSELHKKAPPVRTPPSIPSKHQQILGTPTQNAHVYNTELEHHARKERSPRHYVEKIVDLRQQDPSSSSGSNICCQLDSDIAATSLKVCRLAKPRNTNMNTDEEILQSILRDSTFGSVDESKKHVGFKENYSEAARSYHSQHPDFSSRKTLSNISSIGRPIPQVKKIPDPDRVAAAVQKQNDAKAAVDIQRIFRGYLARNLYKMLIKEQREKLEDERKAALQIQRNWRGHVTRKNVILKRPPNEEQIQWAKDFKGIQQKKAEERKAKIEELSKQDSFNYHQAANKISVIGPHVDVYDIYHPKQVGPSKIKLSGAAVILQKYMRGWLLRNRMDKMKRKATFHGTTWSKMVREYKSLLIRVQKRHGIEKTTTPFTIDEMNDWIEKKRRYESVFDKRAYGSDLDKREIEVFFNDCDLFPSTSEIEDAITAVFRGKNIKMKHKKGFTKSEVLEIAFQIYVPPATGLKDTRQSTWMNPIIGGVEARRLIGTEDVEPAPLGPCVKLVTSSIRERKQKLEEQKKLEEMEEDRNSN